MGFYESGIVVLLSPKDYFDDKSAFASSGLKLGKNALILYETQSDLESYPPGQYDLTEASKRYDGESMGGEYLIWIVSPKVKNIPKGDLSKGLGIPIYEYARRSQLADAVLQLETLFWLCYDSIEVASEVNKISLEEALSRKEEVLSQADKLGLLSYSRAISARMINEKHHTVCPLCMQELSARDFLCKNEQSEGRESSKNNSTMISLFHIKELRYGEYNHKAYNLGWGHYRCNIIAGDYGIENTLDWLKDVCEKQETVDSVRGKSIDFPLVPISSQVSAAIPKLASVKIFNSAQTRGANKNSVYLNRVRRSSTAVIKYAQWVKFPIYKRNLANGSFPNGVVVIMSPSEYMLYRHKMTKYGLALRHNTLILYENSNDFINYPPDKDGLVLAKSRPVITEDDSGNMSQSLDGDYITRLPQNNCGIEGGVGIPIYEYATEEQTEKCLLQLEALYWLCFDSIEATVENGIDRREAKKRKGYILKKAKDQGLLCIDEAIKSRMINESLHTICPFCREEMSARDFLCRESQAEGRKTSKITQTVVSLFHIKELCCGEFNHRPYNLGWGHNRCNIVVGEYGIDSTLSWAREVLKFQNYLGRP